MDFGDIVNMASNTVYPMQGATAIYGLYLTIIVLRRVAVKRFTSRKMEEEFREEMAGRLSARDYEGAAELCDTPPYWSKAACQLMLLVLAKRTDPVKKLRQMVAERFEADVLTELEYRMAWINTLIKTAPMLGLQGTVLGMIAAFAKIASADKSGIDPKALATDIAFALWTTAIGLIIAIPMIVALNIINVRIGKLQDNVQDLMGWFLNEFEDSTKKR